MNIIRLFLITAASMTLWACDNAQEEWTPGYNENGTGNGNTTGNTGSTATNWSERAKETYDAIVRFYEVKSGPTQGLYYENYPKGAGDGNASYLWPYDGFVAGVAMLNKLGYETGYKEKVDRFQAYWRPYGAIAVGGYGSSTDGTNGGGDRFFDDNAIIGIELVEAYEQLGDPAYLNRCAQIINFYNTGIDNTMGRALWWNESLRNIPGDGDSNKPACANGFATWFLMRYYEVCPEGEKAEVLALAKDLYKWLYENLRDPEDNIYWNSKGADGSINRTKWTYNSGAMIAAGVRLYEATGDVKYLNEAKATANSSYDYFVKSRNGISLCYPTNDPWFTIQLIKSYLELEPYNKDFCKKCMDTFIANLENAWENGRMENGLFYEDWTGVNKNPDRDKSLLMQAAALESLAIVALYTAQP